MRQILFILSFLIVCAAPALAQDATSNDFNIRVFGGIDGVPPTTPVLSVDAVTSNQIELSWSTSTDNFLLEGYRIFRDSIVIATTSLQTYTDTGLTPSTTYAYFVQAFDNTLNYSTSSNIVAVTTPAPPVVQSTSYESTAARVVLRGSSVVTGVSTTTINLSTAFPSRIELRWGRTNSFELGYVVSSVFKRDSSFELTGLEPGTTYQFEIVGYTPFGQEAVLMSDTFTTESVAVAVSPPNVNRFFAEVNGRVVNLSWLNPDNIDINFVRIVRSHLGYPAFPTDGAVVYQGRGESVTDESILDVYSPVYYTAFLYDASGNVSSGAVAIAYRQEGEDSWSDREAAIDIVATATSTIDTARLPAGMRMPSPAEIKLIQGVTQYSMFDAPLNFNNVDTVLIRIPVEAISGNLKSIIGTILDPTDNKKTYSFLLRINQDRSAYEASFQPFGVVGGSQAKLEVYDFESFALATYQTPIVFSEKEESVDDTIIFPDILFDRINSILLIIVLMASTILITLLIWRQRGEDNDDEV